LEKILPHLKPIDNLLYIDLFEYTGSVGKDSLLYMPETMEAPPTVGRIFAKGPGMQVTKCAGCRESMPHTRVTADVEVGDYVFWSGFDGKPYQVEYEGEIYEFTIIPDDILLGVLDMSAVSDDCDDPIGSK